MIDKKPHLQKAGFTLIELMISVAIICIIAAVATALFVAYRQKTQISACLSSAHSIRASLISYATTAQHGAYPRQGDISTWAQLAEICNSNGSDLPENPDLTGFQNWLMYTAIDNESDGVIDDFSLDLRLTIVSRYTLGAQLHITTREIIKQTY